jgi:hypothetical protein
MVFRPDLPAVKTRLRRAIGGFGGQVAKGDMVRIKGLAAASLGGGSGLTMGQEAGSFSKRMLDLLACFVRCC